MNLFIKTLIIIICCSIFFISTANADVPVVNPVNPLSKSIPTVVDKPTVLSEKNRIIPTYIVGEPVARPTTQVVYNSPNTNLVTDNTTKNFQLYSETDTSLKSQTTVNGLLIDQRIMGPGLPPVGWEENTNLADFSDISTKSLSLGNIPAMTWSYGCSATSATMLFGYYDRTGYSDMYVGPTNGGVFPLTNAAWGSSSEGNGQCPLTASQYGLDGRTTRGHKDDYYYSSGSSTDPYYNSWTEHSPQDSIGDFMGTNMYKKYSNIDGSTTFWYYSNGAPTYDFTYYDSTSRDGMHGMRLFAESRGYTVTTNYNQYIDTMGLSQGFTYAQYKAEIDAGYPVLIQVNGHTMLGVGYSGTDQVIVHNTWDYLTHTMTWGGYYSGMKHYGVGVIHLESPSIEAKFYGVPDVDVFPLTVHFYDASVGEPNSWSWNFGDGNVSTEQNPSHTYSTPGTYNVQLSVET